MKAYLTITNNCNLKCPHCCYNSGPGEPTMPFGEITSVIDNLPENLKEIWLSGGEVFTRKKLLYKTLRYIQDKRSENLGVVVQTNALWATKDEKTNRVLEELIELGVTGIQVASNDIYHKRTGIDMKRPRRLMKFADEWGMNRSHKYNPSLRVFPVGKAGSLDKSCWGYWDRTPDIPSCLELNPPSESDSPFVCIKYEGSLYACGWMVPGTELGDVRKEKAAEILKRGLENEIISALLEEDGPRELARKVGMSEQDIEELEGRYGPCGLCWHLFSEKLIKL